MPISGRSIVGQTDRHTHAQCSHASVGLGQARPNKTWYLNIIEYSFFLNLAILASATLYTSTISGQGHIAVAYTSVSFGFAVFIVIVMFHILAKCTSSQHYNRISINIGKKLRVKLSKLMSAIRKLLQAKTTSPECSARSNP